jgi:hypothetical protein
MKPGRGPGLNGIKEGNMNKQKKYYITFGAQMGDTLSDAIIGSHLTELIHLLDKYCDYHYAEDIDEFAPVLRVDGDIWHWEFEGLQMLRLLRKKRAITVDIGMPRNRWQNVSPSLIRQFLITNLKLALEAFVDRLKKEKIAVDDERLFDDFKKVEKAYIVNREG